MLQRSLQNFNEVIRRDHLKFNLRLRHKINRENEEKKPPKVAADVLNFLQSTPENRNIIEKLPKSLLKKYKSPESMYLIDRKTAKEITKTIKNYLDKGSPLIEVNPGLGLLSEELLKCQGGHIYMYESLNNFSPILKVSINSFADFKYLIRCAIHSQFVHF